MKRFLQIILVVAFIMALPIGNSAYAEENNVIYSNDNSVVYQNEDGSKTALISIPDDVKEGDSILVYSDSSTETYVYIDVAEMVDVPSTYSFGYGSNSWSGSVPDGTTKLIPHISTSVYTNIGFTMNITSTGSTITSASNPAITGLLVTVSNPTLSINNSIATSSNYASATMNWYAELTEGGLVVGSAYCYLQVYMNSYRELRMEWYA